MIRVYFQNAVKDIGATKGLFEGYTDCSLLTDIILTSFVANAIQLASSELRSKQLLELHQTLFPYPIAVWLLISNYGRNQFL